MTAAKLTKSTVSRICSEIDEQVDVFRTRRLDHLAFPYVYVDATYVKARVDHHIVSRAVVIAIGVASDGNREVLGLDAGDSEDEVFWTQPRPGPGVLQFECGADNATSQGRRWRLFGAYRFENQATCSGITCNALTP